MKRTNGFTLIELFIVISIIAIMIGMVWAGVNYKQRNGHKSAHHHATHTRTDHITEYRQPVDNSNNDFLFWYILMSNSNGYNQYYYASSPTRVTNYSGLNFTSAGGGISSSSASLPPSISNKLVGAEEIAEKTVDPKEEPQQLQEQEVQEQTEMDASQDANEAPGEGSGQAEAAAESGSAPGESSSYSDSSSSSSGDGGGGDGGGGGGGD